MKPTDFSPNFDYFPVPEIIKPFSFADIIRERMSKGVTLNRPLKLLHANLSAIKNEVVTQNQDWIFQVCGEVGVGKSTLALELAMFLDPTFDMSTQMIWEMSDWARFNRNDLYGNTPFKVMLFDEAVSMLFSREGTKGENTDLIKWLTKARACNYYVIFVIPNPWSLDLKIREERSKTMLFTWKNKEQKNQRRYYSWYNASQLSGIAQNQKNASKLLRNPKEFIKRFRPSFTEAFPRLEPAVETAYLKYKKTDYRAFTDGLIKKYTPKEKKKK